jgi:metallo-beta-lactamase class B
MSSIRLLVACLGILYLFGADLTSQPAATGQSAAGTPSQATPASRAARLQKEQDNVELQNVPPFKVFDNLYYVGVGYVGAWLVTTNQGLILIDTLEGAYKDHALESIRKLGFDPKDIKYIVLTHYHLDHTAGAAGIQDASGARVAMGEADWDAITQVANPRNERLPRRDIVVKDGDTLTLGSTTLKLYVMPGHTPGTLAIDFTVYDERKPYRAFLLGGAAPGAGKLPAQQFVASISRMEQMQNSLQVRIVTHPWMDPEFWERVDTLNARKPGDAHPFVSPEILRSWVRDLKAAGTKRLADLAGSP